MSRVTLQSRHGSTKSSAVEQGHDLFNSSLKVNTAYKKRKPLTDVSGFSASPLYGDITDSLSGEMAGAFA